MKSGSDGDDWTASKMSGRPDELFRVRFMVDGETTVDNGTISGWQGGGPTGD